MAARKTKAATPPPKKRNRVGRPTKFDAGFYERATDYCLLGATNEQLAEFFEVGLTTLNRWLADDEKFRNAIKKGREEADAQVTKSLYKRALGYSHPKVHVSNYLGQITLTPLIEHYPPDTAAAFIWLKNRQPKRWRDKQPEGDGMSAKAVADAIRAELDKLDAEE